MYSLQMPPAFLQRLSFSNTRDKPKVPLTISTNSIRRGNKSRPKHILSVTSSKKASPTVSLSNASALSTATSCLLPSPAGLPDAGFHSYIPFPSSPIPCQSSHGSPDELDLDLVSFVIIEHDTCTSSPEESSSCNSTAAAWHIDLHRRCVKSCLASSYVHSETSSKCVEEIFPKVMSYSSTQGRVSSSKSTRRRNKNKKRSSDLQFTAMVHRSIAGQLNRVLDHSGALSELDDGFLDQDGLLLGRLWEYLVNHGFNLSLLEVKCQTTAADSEPPCPVSRFQRPEIPRLEIPPPAVLLPSPAPSPAYVKGKSDTLNMSQLVAALILRFNDRHSTRPRTTSSIIKHIENQLSDRPRRHSPLSNVIVPYPPGLDIPSSASD